LYLGIEEAEMTKDLVVSDRSYRSFYEEHE
jgi:hypothetical protein